MLFLVFTISLFFSYLQVEWKVRKKDSKPREFSKESIKGNHPKVGSIVFTSWYDVSHAMGFRVWGRTLIKNHSFTLLDINLCIKHGLNTFSPPPRQVYPFKVTVYVYLWGGTKARICRTTWTDSKWRPVP